MANTFAPFGLSPIGHRDGSAPTMGMERKYIPSSDPTAYFQGDPVSISSVSGQYIIAPSCGTVGIYGVFNGCEFFSQTVQRTVFSNTFPGSIGSSFSNDATCWVITDPEMCFLVQAGGLSATAASSVGVGSSQIGLNIGTNASTAIAVSSLGNTVSGLSVVSAISTSAATSSSLPFVIVDVASGFLPPGANGTDSTSASNIIVVQFNNTNRHAGTVGV